MGVVQWKLAVSERFGANEAADKGEAFGGADIKMEVGLSILYVLALKAKN